VSINLTKYLILKRSSISKNTTVNFYKCKYELISFAFTFTIYSEIDYLDVLTSF